MVLQQWGGISWKWHRRGAQWGPGHARSSPQLCSSLLCGLEQVTALSFPGGSPQQYALTFIKGPGHLRALRALGSWPWGCAHRQRVHKPGIQLPPVQTRRWRCRELGGVFSETAAPQSLLSLGGESPRNSGLGWAVLC